ncbi:Cof-type HAD-IIB family hydrolase [Entomospira entomophila]|uniref:HAD family phosphatase n=1 Tax=Entomospira entomophila TaxID=2719988 RepID=A0A968G8Q9_9SPIO|nr:Cof-type HAD-IIB family hydrolase [Entomospira entomophilus]NIZ40632.1 HAD family phosphatase [Entomospira entomophilus]WDI34846.1 Cof-type HAD-IIB family hydrolase [Entomospira entomophilus]
MKEIKMVAIDMDGTILRHDETGVFISDVTKKAIHDVHSMGIKVVIATGRSYGILKDFIAELGLLDNYHVMCNGAATLSPSDEFINLHGLPVDLYKIMVERLTLARIPFAVFDADLSYCLPFAMQADAHAYRESIVRESLLDLPFITKLVVGPYDAQAIEDQIKDLDVSLAVSVFQGVTYAEIWPQGLHKGTAVEEVAHVYGIAIDNVMAVGDGGNDKAMLTHVGWGVAMGNATDDVKSHANAVTDTIDNDGLAQALEKYIIRKDFS